MIPRWEFRHLPFWATLRLGGSIVLVLVAVTTFAYGSPAWTVFFLALACVAFAAGCWELAVARAAPPRHD